MNKSLRPDQVLCVCCWSLGLQTVHFCKKCSFTGLDLIPWSELFRSRRTDWVGRMGQ